jgi:hypothetical protein
VARPRPVEPVKLLVAVLWSNRSALEESLALLRQQWGDIDFSGADHPFDATDYYESEMGAGIQRRLISMAELTPPENLCECKLACNELEERLAGEAGRRVNLDVGYLDHNKIVLASVKYAGQKIHLGRGVYADLVARYSGGRYRPFEWTFPDFRDGRYDSELAEIRRTYLNQLRERRAEQQQRH